MAIGDNIVKTEKEFHLSEGQLLDAIIDMAEMSSDLRDHLNACPQCRRARYQSERGLEQLGQTAARYVPVPRKRIVIPIEESSRGMVWFRQWRASMGVAATALALIILVWGSDPIHVTPGNNDSNLVLENQEAEMLIMEVNMLVENVLPQLYLEICAESELDFNDEFIQYIVPVLKDNPVPLISREKGVRLC